MNVLRYAFRSLTKSPGFTSVAVLTLALGIGASAAIFSIVNAVLLAPLPYPHPEQLVRVWEQAPDGHRMNLADPNFADFRNQNDTFATLAAYALWDASLSGGSEPVRAQLGVVSEDYFRTFGVQPVIGRLFAPNEFRAHTPGIVVSYGYWKRYLGATPDLSRMHLLVAGETYPVIGVMPADFDQPSGVSGWIAREHDTEPSRTAHNWRGIGRLRNDVSVAQARANLTAIGARIKGQYGKDADLDAAEVLPLADALVGDVRKALLTLCGAVGLLLLVGCANVAGLMLARASARAKELAVRTALGAGRIRIVQQFLAESFVLAVMSGIAGVAIAVWAVKLLPALVPATLPRRDGIALNVPVLLFAIAVTIAVAIALGVFSSWRASASGLQALTASSRGLTASRSAQRMRVVLVIGEIATTLTILVAAGLLGRSFLHLIETNSGFRAENLITAQFSLPDSAAPNAKVQAIQRVDRIVERVREAAGAEAAGVANALPVAHGDNLADGTFLLLRGENAPADFRQFEVMSHDASRTGQASYCSASAGYFQTLGIPLIRGRMFSDSDTANSPHVAVISEALARQRFSNEDPIGQQIEFGNMDGDPKPLTVVGIVGDVRAQGLDRPATRIIYVDYRQRGAGETPTILIRSTSAAAEIIPTIRGVFREVAPDVPVKISTYETELGGWLAQRRFVLFLVALFAAVALGLAALGIYGVIAFSVARRTQEIGIRMALGARPGDVLRLVLGEAARMAGTGILAGMVVSLSITRLMSSLLFDVRATDPWTFTAVAALLTAVALFASYVPARRAMRVAPEVALRYE